MAKILVDQPVTNVTVYDPSAGSGTLLMNVAHEIGEKNCTIYSQDISQKSSGMLRLNLILNDLVHSIPNVIQGNTLVVPAHKDKNDLKKFDFIVSNPPFKLDFSDFREDLDKPENKARFFAGIPTIPKKKLDSMSIYLLFMQHIIYSLSSTGKAAVVVPTGFLTAQDGISLEIRKRLVDLKILSGAISMPSNIFATTGTNVSVVFIDKSADGRSPIFIDASNLGTAIKEGKNQKTVLSTEEELLIIESFRNRTFLDQFTAVPSIDEIKVKKYSFSAGQYFAHLHKFEELSVKEYGTRIKIYEKEISELFNESNISKKQIISYFKSLDARD